MNFLRTVFLAFSLYAIGVSAVMRFLTGRGAGAANSQTASSLNTSSPDVPWDIGSGEAVKTACAQFIATIMQYMAYQINHPNSPYTVVMNLRVADPNANETPLAFPHPSVPGQVYIVPTDTNAVTLAPNEFLVAIKDAMNETLNTLDTYERNNPYHKMPFADRARALRTLCLALKANSFANYPPEHIKEVLFRFYNTLEYLPLGDRKVVFLQFYRNTSSD